MPKVYLSYAPENAAFARRLANDLIQRGFDCRLADHDSAEQFVALREAEFVVVALTTNASKDARVLVTLEAALQSGKRIIALRIGAIEALPKSLKGVLPLDFTNDALYDDNLTVLLEDLVPPPPPAPLLPEEIQLALASENPHKRKQGIEMLGGMRQELDADIRDLAQQTLRDLAFKDPESSLKSLARTTLQLFDADLKRQTGPLEEVVVVEDAPEREVVVAAALHEIRAVTAPLISRRVPVWGSNEWWLLPIVGAVLALIQAVLARELMVILPIAAVWIVLPWFNVVVRDEGRMEWKMPAPLIGNAVVALVIALIMLVIASVIGNLSKEHFAGSLALSVLYGAFIGWASTLYKH